MFEKLPALSGHQEERSAEHNGRQTVVLSNLFEE
jgi:hypothetical protein